MARKKPATAARACPGHTVALSPKKRWQMELAGIRVEPAVIVTYPAEQASAEVQAAVLKLLLASKKKPKPKAKAKPKARKK